MYKLYKNSKEALIETDNFYSNSGFMYDPTYVVNWIKLNILLPKKKSRILDLCCGDGIWSYGFPLINSDYEIYGCDISSGGIKKAKSLLNNNNLIICDVEKKLPYDDNFFDLIFCRGPGLYNQHDFDKPQCRKVISNWHKKLSTNGLFYSIFASDRSKFGTYTEMENSVLPYNRSPRKSPTIDFLGGKFHHSIQSFTTPFQKINDIEIKEYIYKNNLHILVTTKL